MKINDVYFMINPLNEDELLSKIDLKQLDYGLQEGTFLILKIKSTPKKELSLNMLLENSKQEEIFCSLFNYEEEFNIKNDYDITIKFAIGNYVIIINPYFKNYSEALYGFHITNPKEFVLFNNFSDLVNYINKFKLPSIDLTENSYKNNKNKENTILMAKTYFLSKSFKKTLNFCENVLKQNPDFTEIINIKLKSLLKCRKFNEAFEYFNENKNKIINYEQMKKNLEEKQKNLKGEFNLYEMLKTELNKFYQDSADYINPKIEITKDEEKGIKIIAKEKINKSELICANKAMFFLRPEEISVENEYNFQKKLFKISDKIPEEFPEIFTLYDGNNKHLNINQRASQNKHLKKEKLANIIKYNSFDAFRFFFMNKFIGTGIYYFSSFFNHSCVSNSFTFPIGDFLFVYAKRNIEINEEITINYIPSENLYKIRKDYCNEKNFVCNCDLCKNEKKSENNKNTIELNNYIENVILSKESNKLENFIKEKGKDFFINFLNNNNFSDFEIKIGYFFYSKKLLIFDEEYSKELILKGIEMCKNDFNFELNFILLYYLYFFRKIDQKNMNILKEQIKNIIRKNMTKDEKFIDLYCENSDFFKNEDEFNKIFNQQKIKMNQNLQNNFFTFFILMVTFIICYFLKK